MLHVQTGARTWGSRGPCIAQRNQSDWTRCRVKDWGWCRVILLPTDTLRKSPWMISSQGKNVKHQQNLQSWSARSLGWSNKMRRARNQMMLPGFVQHDNLLKKFNHFWNNLRAGLFTSAGFVLNYLYLFVFTVLRIFFQPDSLWFRMTVGPSLRKWSQPEQRLKREQSQHIWHSSTRAISALLGSAICGFNVCCNVGNCSSGKQTISALSALGSKNMFAWGGD